MERFLLNDAQYKKMAPLLPGKSGDSGRTAADNRLFVEAVLWIVRTGAPWRDLLQAMRTDAGHAAVALARGCRIDDVAIAPVAEVNFTYRRYATYVMVAPAGTIAQLRARPGSPRRDDVDFARAYEAAARIGNPRQVFKQLWPKTKELVALRWHQVDVIAALLLRYEKLTGSQLNKVLIRPPRRRVARVVRGRQRLKADMRQRWLAQSG